MRLSLRYLIVVPLIVGLGWAGLVAANIARADAYVLEASKEMGTWAASRVRPSSGTWDTVNDQLGASAALVGSDPTTQELLGILAAGRTDSGEYMANAVVHLTHALARRPGSPYTWANLAEAKYLQGETDANFELALRQAAELGPAEPEVQRMVANYGLAVWKEVSPETRTAIDRMIGAGVRRNPLEMLQISERRGRLNTACRHLVDVKRTPEPKWYQLCQSTEATS